MDAKKTVQCVVVTPEKALLDVQADSIVVPLYDGELGVFPGRLPLIGRLGFGELRVRTGTQVQRFYIDGGFAQVRGNTVTVLTPAALRADEIKVSEQEQILSKREATTSKAAQDAAVKTQSRARAQLRIAERAKSDK